MVNYDAIVIGAGIAGLGVAGLLQMKGLKTVVFEKSRIPGGRCKTFDLDGWKVDSGTHCVDLGTHSPCAVLLSKLNREIPWSENLKGLLFYDDGSWKNMNEYLSMSPEEEHQIRDLEKWMLNMTDEEIDQLDTVSLSKLIDQKVTSLKIAEFMKTIGMIQTTLTHADIISAGEFAAIYREALRTASTSGFPYEHVRIPLGGVSTMIRAMVEAYESLGGTLLLGTPVQRLRVKPDENSKVIVDEGVFDTPAVVVAAPIWNMMNFLSLDEMSCYVPAWATRIRSMERETSASMGFTIGTRVPLFTEQCYLSAWRLPGIDLPLQVFGPTLFDPTRAPAGHMIAFIGACCTPAQALDKKFREKNLAAFWEVTKKMFPAMEDNLLWKQDGFYVGVDGLSRSPGMTGRFRPPVHLPEMPGLYFAGDCYTGRGIGMNAAANSAMICAEEILGEALQ